MTILDSIRSAGPKPDKVPEGWMTVAQVSRALGKSPSHTRYLIREQVREGRAIMREFKIKTQGRGVYPVPHYKAKG